MAVTVANGNLELAAQFLLEGGPVMRMPLPGHVPPEVTRRMASGPGRITTPPNEPPAVYRLVAAAAEIGAADELHAIADLAREDPTALRPLLDRLASTHLPLLRLVCEQPRAFKLMLNPDWRAKAREYARAAVEAREQVVRAVDDRINHAQIAMSRATVEASMASSHGALAHARARAERAGRDHRRRCAERERAMGVLRAAEAELATASSAERAHLSTLVRAGTVMEMWARAALNSQQGEFNVQLLPRGAVFADGRHAHADADALISDGANCVPVFTAASPTGMMTWRHMVERRMLVRVHATASGRPHVAPILLDMTEEVGVSTDGMIGNPELMLPMPEALEEQEAQEEPEEASAAPMCDDSASQADADGRAENVAEAEPMDVETSAASTPSAEPGAEPSAQSAPACHVDGASPSGECHVDDAKAALGRRVRELFDELLAEGYATPPLPPPALNQTPRNTAPRAEKRPTRWRLILLSNCSHPSWGPRRRYERNAAAATALQRAQAETMGARHTP